MDKGLKKFTIHLAKSPFTSDQEKQKAYRQVFNDPVGSKVLQDILRDAGYYAPFVPNPRNPGNGDAALFDQGKRFVCYTILNTMTVKIKQVEAQRIMTEGLESYETIGIEE